MPVTISVKNDLLRLTARLDDLQKRQIPFAASRALNDAAQAAKRQVTSELPTIFDRPTPFTMNAIAVLSSRKDNLVAMVLVKDQQAKYLAVEETGGERTPAMNSRVASRALTAPGVAAPLNQFGNLPNNYQQRLRAQAEADRARRRAAREKIVAHRKKAALRRRGGRKAASDKGVIYFAGKGPRGRGPGGYFTRGPGHTLRRLTGFESVEHYKPRFGFRHRVEVAARAAFVEAVPRRLAEALRS